jgi:hypothetical protein
MGAQTFMRFVFLSAHKVFGIILKPSDPDVPLIQTEDEKLSVFMTGSLDRHYQVLDRQTALAVMLLSGRVKQPLPDDFSDQLSIQIDAVRKQRSELADGTGIVVIQISGDIEAVIPEPRRNIADFILCFDAFDKKALASKLQPKVASALAGLRIGARGDYEFEQISSGSYLVTDDDLIVHSFTAELGSLRAYVSSPLNDEQIARVKNSIELLNRSGELARVARLYAQSINRDTDSFRAFVSAWSALEILIGKIFPVYQRQLAGRLETVSVAPGLKTYLTRVADVMSDKHTLADKFAVIAMFLDEAQDPAEIELFKKLKKVRDRLSHGEDVLDGSLPTTEVQKLFEKYLSNHMRTNV